MKKRAAERVFSMYFNADVVMVSVSTGMPPQPVGLGELVKGAALRATNAMKAVSHADFGVGIEAGLLEFVSSTGFVEVQVAVIVGRDGRASIGLSQGFELPPEIVDKMLLGVELASASGIQRGVKDIGESIGYIGVKTWGKVTRQDLTEQALLMALVPWLEGAAWLVSVEDLIAQASHLPKPQGRKGGKN
jgi:inosine/xanthosine triphosphatase